MIKPITRATIYFDEMIHRALKIKAAATSKTISDLVNDAVRHELMEDAEDLAVFEDRVSEPTVSYENLLKDLKKNGKI